MRDRDQNRQPLKVRRWPRRGACYPNSVYAPWTRRVEAPAFDSSFLWGPGPQVGEPSEAGNYEEPKAATDYEETTEDKEIVNTGSELFEIWLEKLNGLRHKRPNQVDRDDGSYVMQDHYEADLFVDLRTGLILDIGGTDTVDPGIIDEEYTAHLTIQMLIDRPEFIREDADYKQYYFAIDGPEDTETGRPVDPALLISERALHNLNAVLENVQS